MPVQVFYNPEMVAKLRSVGIGARGAGPSVSAPRSSQGPRTVTLAPSSSTPRSAIGAVEEAARLRAQVTQLQRDNQRLSEAARTAACGRHARIRGEPRLSATIVAARRTTLRCASGCSS